MSTLNHALKDAPADLFDMSRWSVLTILIVHCNIRRRCWPSITRIQKIIGKSRPVVIAALKWLTECGAVELVEANQRIGEEKKVNPRQHIYQVTGALDFGGKHCDYLYIAPENGDSENGADGKDYLPSMVKKTTSKDSLPKVYTEDNTSNSNLAGASATRTRADLDSMYESIMRLFGVPRDNATARKAKNGLVVKFRQALLDCDPTVTPDRVEAFTVDLASKLAHASKLKDSKKFAGYYGDFVIDNPPKQAPAARKDGDDWTDALGTRRRQLQGVIERLDPITYTWQKDS